MSARYKSSNFYPKQKYNHPIEIKVINVNVETTNRNKCKWLHHHCITITSISDVSDIFLTACYIDKRTDKVLYDYTIIA